MDSSFYLVLALWSQMWNTTGGLHLIRFSPSRVAPRGIGTYMIYHLIQTCLGKDVTLHVSVTNPAMLMFQKFGFKPEEFIRDVHT